MSEYILKADAIDDLHTQLMYRMGSDDMKRRLDDWVKTLPSADVVQVVRCVQCKYWQGNDSDYDYGYCYANDGHGFGHAWGKNDFCSYGERKE